MLTPTQSRNPLVTNHKPFATACAVSRDYGSDMKPDIERIKLRVQAALDELISEHLIPFKLTAQRVNMDGPGKYIVPFYDSRIHSFGFSWTDGVSSFNEVVRAAVLKRVTSMDGPPIGWIA